MPRKQQQEKTVKTTKKARLPKAGAQVGTGPEMKAYRLTYRDAQKLLHAQDVDIADRAAVQALAAGFSPDESPGTAEQRLARHAIKWLPQEGSETTINLTDAEAKAYGLKEA